MSDDIYNLLGIIDASKALQFQVQDLAADADSGAVVRKAKEFYYSLGDFITTLEKLLDQVRGTVTESAEEDSLVSDLDKIISDFENTKTNYHTAYNQLEDLKQKAARSNDTDLVDEIQDYINRMDRYDLGESNKDLVGIKFKDTLRRLSRRASRIKNESPTYREFIDAMNSHNDEIEKYLRSLSSNDPRVGPLTGLVIYTSDYSFKD